MRRKGTIRIGTSGWSYDHWEHVFYPDELPAEERLGYYQQRFDTVEINNSFYHLPDTETFRKWRDHVSPDFRFSVKASRYITHMKKLKTDTDALPRFYAAIQGLGESVGVILFQLPPRWHFNAERLASFLATLDSRYHYAFEFRDHSWIKDDCLALLRRHDVSFCIYELAGYRTPLIVTNGIAYVRLHGPEEAYRGRYGQRGLGRWCKTISGWQRDGIDVFVYFDNDEQGFATADAMMLQTMCDT